MTFDQLNDFLQKHKELVDSELVQYIQRLQAPKTLQDAMLYSIKAGGKRLRPILLLATMEAFGRNPRHGQAVACAIEMIHTYSLIHDDLPAMDDDDLRRGQPSNHKMFGESNAILAGDALLTYSFEVIADMDVENIPDGTRSQLIAKLARAAGPEGMVGGQVTDLEAEGKSLTLAELEHIHRYKTAKLLAFAVEAGAILSQANESQVHNLKRFAAHLGLAFQIRDDILDIEGDVNEMGKTPGSDTNKHKSTYPQLLTLEGTKEKLAEQIDLAKHYLYKADINHTLLEDLTEYTAQRNY